MELLIRDRDYVSDGAGGLVRVSGRAEMLERVLFRLSARRGALPFAPELGSELHRLWSEKPGDRLSAAKKYVMQALSGEAGVTVGEVFLRQSGDVLEVTVQLRYEGGETEVNVAIGGEDTFGRTIYDL